MNKARSAQLAEKEAIKYDSIARDAELERISAQQRLKAEELAKQQEVERQIMNQRYQEALELQLEVRCDKYKCLYAHYVSCVLS